MKIIEAITMETAENGSHVIVNQSEGTIRATVCEPGDTALAVVECDSWPCYIDAFMSLARTHEAPQTVQ